LGTQKYFVKERSCVRKNTLLRRDLGNSKNTLLRTRVRFPAWVTVSVEVARKVLYLSQVVTVKISPCRRGFPPGAPSGFLPKD